MNGARLRYILLIRLVLAVASALAPWTVRAEEMLPQVQFTQHLGERLPLQLEFTDETGQRLRLAQLFGERPVLLVPGYLRCPALCSTVLDSVMQSLTAGGVPGTSYRLLAISIDPQETPAMAAQKKARYGALLAQDGIDLHILTGAEEPIRRLASSIGFGYAYNPSDAQYRHPAGFLLTTPDGRINRYFPGAGFEPGEVREAVRTAAQGSIGSLAQQVLLTCAHYDPQTGRYSITAMAALRACMLGVLAALLVGWWRLRGREARRGR